MRFGDALISCHVFTNSPCCVDFIDRSKNIFIVGTYELDSSESKSAPSNPSNQRQGSLSVFKEGHLLFDSSNLSDGGVFDLKILSRELIAVAHANGHIVFYKVNYERKVIDCILRYDTQFSLLTSIDVSVDCDMNIYGIVGTSEGSIVTFQGDLVKQEIKDSSVTQENTMQQPVWCTRLMKSQRPGQRFLLFTGSDDCTMKVFHVTQQTASLTLLCKNKDAGSGVTDICLEETSESSSETDNWTGIVYTGSYDEYLRKYSFIYTENLFKLQLLQSVHLNGAGVWSIKHFDSFLFIAGMFSGVHMIHPSDLSIVHSRTFENDEGARHEGQDNQLIYDLIVFQGSDRSAVVSFYKKALYLLSLHDECEEKD